MLQRGRAYLAGANLNSIMFPDTFHCPAKGMFAAKVPQTRRQECLRYGRVPPLPPHRDS